jgi:hypothetical protein
MTREHRTKLHIDGESIANADLHSATGCCKYRSSAGKDYRTEALVEVTLQKLRRTWQETHYR